MMSEINRNERINFLSKISLVLCFAIILWGAWVRISGSGDGCGQHWPLCKGELLPSLMSIETWIEFFHRAKSGAFGFLVLYIFYLGRKASKQIKTATSFTLFFTITEALLGAKLVLSNLVVNNASLERVVTSALHLSNTTFLITSVVACILFSGKNSLNYSFSLSRQTLTLYFCFLFIAITGSWAALSTQLFPSLSILEAIQKDLSGEHFLLQIRILHPICAIIFGGYLTWVLMKKFKDSSLINLLSKFSIPVTVCVGLITLVTLSPVPLKLFHLFCSTVSCAVIARAVMVDIPTAEAVGFQDQ